MNVFEAAVHKAYDSRISTLAAIKSRSLGSDPLVLSALTVLAYAQLEGGIKDLASLTIKYVNRRKLSLGEVSPRLLKWRNGTDLERLKSSVNFDMIGDPRPFESLLKGRVHVRAIDRIHELNQMSWSSVSTIYDGFALRSHDVGQLASTIDSLVTARNNAAHRGVMPTTTASMIEQQLRGHVSAVEGVLTNFAYQLLKYFDEKLHLR